MIDTKALRSRVLDLAIQGKLTEQLESDGTAEELWQQIQAEKQRLIKEGKIKKEKPLPEISEDEIPFEIPENWKWVRLGDLSAKITSGSTPPGGKKGDAYKPTGYCFFREQNIYNDGIHNEGMVYISEELLNTRENSTVLPNDILLNITGGSIGRCAIVPDDFSKGSINQHILIIRLIDKKMLHYIHDLLCSPYYQKIIQSKVVGDKDGFSGGRCKATLIPLPPLAEQKRIVARVEEIFRLLDIIDAAQEQYAADAESLKAKLITLGIQGRLTEQLESDGTAEELYQQIQAEKQRLIKEGRIKREKPLPEISEDEIPFEIPENWKWVRWGNLSKSIQYGYNAPAKDKGRIKMVRITDIQNNAVQWKTVPYCDIAEDSINDFLLQDGDILFARTGGTVGKSFIVTNISEEAVFAGYLIRTQYSDLLNGQYLKFFMESRLYWKQLQHGTTATAQPNCNAQTLSKMMIPLPPLAEQKRIADRLEELLGALG